MVFNIVKTLLVCCYHQWWRFEKIGNFPLKTCRQSIWRSCVNKPFRWIETKHFKEVELSWPYEILFRWDSKGTSRWVENNLFNYLIIWWLVELHWDRKSGYCRQRREQPYNWCRYLEHSLPVQNTTAPMSSTSPELYQYRILTLTQT
jgi:hypothetical protein